MKYYEIAGTEVRDWQHAWLAMAQYDPGAAYGVWHSMVWDEMEPDEQLAFALAGGWPDWIDGPILERIDADPHSELVEDLRLAVHAYANDSRVPSHMIEPRWCGSWPRDEGEFPF